MWQINTLSLDLPLFRKQTKAGSRNERKGVSVFLSAEVKTFWLWSSYLWFNAAKTNTDLHPKRTQRPTFTSGKKRKTQTIKTLMINQKEFYLSFDCGRQTEVDVSRRAQTDKQTCRVPTSFSRIHLLGFFLWTECRHSCQAVCCDVNHAVFVMPSAPCMFCPVSIYSNKLCQVMMLWQQKTALCHFTHERFCS